MKCIKPTKHANIFSHSVGHFICKTETDSRDLENELLDTRGFGGGGGVVREFETHIYILLYLKWITSKDLLHSTGNSAQFYAKTKIGKEF